MPLRTSRCVRWARISTCSPRRRSWTSSPPRPAGPVEFRLAHLSDPRARAVLEHVARQSDWEMDARRRRRARNRLCPLQEHERLLRGGRRGRGRPGGARAAADDRRRRGTGHQSRRCGRPDRRRRDPGHQLDAQGAGAVRPVQVTSETGRATRSCGSPKYLRSTSNVPGPATRAGRRELPGPTAAAIANAVYDALGVRVRSSP